MIYFAKPELRERGLGYSVKARTSNNMKYVRFVKLKKVKNIHKTQIHSLVREDVIKGL
jgi:hypothetical protein